MYIKIKEAANRLGVFRNTVAKVVEDGQLQAIKVGKQLLIKEEELERYIAECIVEAKQGPIEPQRQRQDN